MGRKAWAFQSSGSVMIVLNKIKDHVVEKHRPLHGTAFHSLHTPVSSGSTQTRHIPEESPSGFHLQSVSKLLLVISFV